MEDSAFGVLKIGLGEFGNISRVPKWVVIYSVPTGFLGPYPP